MRSGRVKYRAVNDVQALNAFQKLSHMEGIIPALESSHALAYVLDNASDFQNQDILVNLSGRGDKDLDIVINQGL
jgi:tryptophan synthase beta chain